MLAGMEDSRSPDRHVFQQAGALDEVRQLTLWRIEVAPVPDLSNVSTPTKAIITIPISIYRDWNGDDDEEGVPRGGVMGGSMGSTRPSTCDADAEPRVLTS